MEGLAFQQGFVLTRAVLSQHRGQANVYGIDKLPLPDAIKANLKLRHVTNNAGLGRLFQLQGHLVGKKRAGLQMLLGSKCINVSRKSCVIS